MFPITHNTQREVEMQSTKKNSFGAQFGGLDIKGASWRWPQTHFYILLAVRSENKTNRQLAGCFHVDDLITKIVEGDDASTVEWRKGKRTNFLFVRTSKEKGFVFVYCLEDITNW